MKRELGFYWVMFKDEWVVAEWLACDKWLSGFHNASYFLDNDFDQIDENRIINPNT